MKNILNVNMETIEEENGIRFRYKAELIEEITEKLPDERLEKIKKLINEATHEISEGLMEYKALETLLEESIEKKKQEIEKKQRELYEKLSNDMKKEVDEFHKEIDKLETSEEKIAYALQKLAETIRK